MCQIKNEVFYKVVKNLLRPIQLKLRVNLEERKKIEEKMELAQIDNFSLFARLMLLSGEVRVIDFKEIQAIRYEVNRIGVNINQLIKLAHEKRNVGDNDLRKITELQYELEERISKIISDNLKKENE